MLGPFDRSTRQTNLLQKIVRGDPIGTLISPNEGVGTNPGWKDGDGRTHKVGNVYSVDVAQACVCVLEAGAKSGGVGLNIASAEAPTWVEFVHMVADALIEHTPPAIASKIKEGITFDFDAVTELVSVDSDVGALHVGLAEKVANCNTNANFVRFFLLEMKKEWVISPEKY